MKTFKNTEMKRAIVALRQNENALTIQQMNDALITGQLLAPAQWDKAPEADENGQMVFAPDTKFQLLVIADDQGNYYFPAFTSMEELKKWDHNNETESLIMTFEQFLPFIEMSKDDVVGIVVDPYSENVPLTCQYILDLNKDRMKDLTEHHVTSDERFNLREPVGNVEELKDNLIAVGQAHQEIKAIYLKERLVKGQPSHWFIVVDMQPENPKLFQVLGESSRPFAKGKGIEFLFASTPEGQRIAHHSQAIYAE